jgi:hypothetical protein
MHDPRYNEGVAKLGVSRSGVGDGEVTTCRWCGGQMQNMCYPCFTGIGDKAHLKLY